ncbi:MAG: hypothetical protein AAF433_20345 [Bacteroidota bacterium]
MKSHYLSLALLLLLSACAGARTKSPEKSFVDRWDLTIFGTPLGTVNGILTIVQAEGELSGTFSSQGEVIPLKTVSLEAEKLSTIFFYPAYGVDVDIVLEGMPTANTLEGETYGDFRTVAERVSNP